MQYLNTNSSIEAILNALSSNNKSPLPGGFAMVLDNKNRLIGVISDSDIRKKFQNSRLELDKIKASDLMQSNYLFLFVDELQVRDFSRLSDLSEIRSIKSKSLVQFIPILERDMTISKILHITDIIEIWEETEEEIFVLGLGFVGLTLALALAEKGCEVFGIDSDHENLQSIRSLEPKIYEPHIELILKNTLERTLFLFNSILAKSRSAFRSRVYIICVGSPVIDKQIDEAQLMSAIDNVIGNFKKGDTIIVRSTVSVGTSRRLANKVMNSTGLTPGIDFFFGYAPERTVEGNAIEECFSIPQIYSGLTNQCASKVGKFFEKFSSSRIKCESLESCEMGKLMSNAFRDVNFAFSNEMASFAKLNDIDINRLIDEVNSGYLRNQIKHPSPGVSGPCLSKDSYILNSLTDSKTSLIYTARTINETVPIVVVEELLDIVLKYNLKNILIVGVAFKGVPETNDIRNSSNLEIAQNLSKSNLSVRVYDSVVKDKVISSVKLYPHVRDEPWSPNLVCILNNHPNNLNYVKSILTENSSIILFDPWYLCSTIYDSKSIRKVITMSTSRDKFND